MATEGNVTSLKCAIIGCGRTANVLCHCCQENLCRNHYSEHDYLNAKLTMLSDEIDSFDRQLLGVDLKKYIQNTNDRLHQWRMDSYKAIDQYCDVKYREIEQSLMKVIAQKRDHIDQVRTNMLDLTKKRKMTLEVIEALTTTLREIEGEMVDIDQKHLLIQTSPLVVDRGLIQVEEFILQDFDVSALTTVYKSLDYPRPGIYPIASNSQFLLIHREPNLCLLDRHIKVIKQAPWNYGSIVDMCWSSALDKFILITLSQIYIFDIPTLTIDRIDATQKLRWLACTCSETSLFLSTNENGSAVCEFNLLNSMQAAKRWEPPDTCSNDERIHDMIYNKGALFFLVENSATGRVRAELRSSTRFDRLWALQIDINYQGKFLSCALLSADQWLIVDSNSSRLFHITMDGKLKSAAHYSPVPCSASTFGSDLLAVSTLNGINIHRV